MLFNDISMTLRRSSSSPSGIALRARPAGPGSNLAHLTGPHFATNRPYFHHFYHVLISFFLEFTCRELRIAGHPNSTLKDCRVDRLAALLDHNGAANYLVEIGSELRIPGRRTDDGPWRVGIEKPTGQGRSVQLIIPLMATQRCRPRVTIEIFSMSPVSTPHTFFTRGPAGRRTTTSPRSP